MKPLEDIEPIAAERFAELVRIAARLRAADGCPWDKVQTHATLKTCLLEEAYEVIDAIDSEDASKLREELGDLLMQVAMHAQLANESGGFSIDESLAEINAKLIRRHPHVFGPDRAGNAAKTPEEVLQRWESIKSEDNDYQTVAEKIERIPAALPALSRAAKVQKAAAMVGFDWPSPAEASEKLTEEAREVKESVREGHPSVAEELGDLLFAVVNVARLLKIDAEDALRQATRKFERRFAAVESRAHAEGRSLSEMSLAEMDEIWNSVKLTEETRPDY